MKSTVATLDGLVRKLSIEVPADKVVSAFEKVYKGIQKNATIKGFRKGKAPLSAVRSAYSERVKQDVLNDLISENYQSALDEHTLEPVGYPNIHFENFAEDSAFKFTAEFEVRPAVSLKKYEGLEVQKEIFKLEDTQINAVLENIRQSQSTTVPVLEDRGVIDGDLVEIDFAGFVAGSPLENGSAEGRLLEIGSKRFIDGFEEALVGMRVGDNREVNLTFPAEYHNAQVAGQPVTFKVALKGLKKKVLPELNDELAEKSGQFKTLDELKDAIRKDILAGEEKRIHDDLRNRLLKALVKNNPIDVPSSLVAQQKQLIIKDVKERMGQQGMGDMDFEEYKAKWDKDFDESAVFMVQSTFLVDALADKLELRAKPTDVEAKIEEYTQQTGIERDKVLEFYKKPERRSRLAFQITEEQVVKFLMDKANIKEVSKEKLTPEADSF